MGKKKKIKKDLFDQDYGDISLEEQLKMSMIADQLISGAPVDIGFLNKPDDSDDDINDESLDSFFGVIAESLGYGSDKYIDGTIHLDLEEESHSDLAELLVEHCEAVSAEDQEQEEEIDENDDEINVEMPHPRMRAKAELKISSVTERKNAAFVELDDTESESEEDDNEDEEEMTPTLDNTFKVIQGDHSLGDIVIKDAWEDFKSHTFTFYNMIPANMNYENSPLYQKMVGFVDFVVAFISGPVLVIKQGNEKFKDFINTVTDFDRERIFVCSKRSETEFDNEGNPAIHFLVYYIDRESKEELEILFETFENPDDENNKIILDFLFSIYKKAIDRHENPWACYDSIDALIDEKESDSDDIDFVLDLIREDSDTVMGESNIDEFMDKFVLPIETFVDSIDADKPGILYTFVELLSYVFDTTRNDFPIENDVIQVPDNFGYPQNPTKVISDDVKTNETKEVPNAKTVSVTEVEVSAKAIEVTVKDEYITDPDIIEGIEIDDVSDDEDIELNIGNEGSLVGTADTSKTVTDTTSSNGIKKFGSTPYQGGSMIIR